MIEIWFYGLTLALKNLKITEWLRWADISEVVWSIHPAQSKFRIPWVVSSQVLNISVDGDSTTFLGSLFQYLTTIAVKRAVFYV